MFSNSSRLGKAPKVTQLQTHQELKVKSIRSRSFPRFHPPQARGLGWAGQVLQRCTTLSWGNGNHGRCFIREMIHSDWGCVRDAGTSSSRPGSGLEGPKGVGEGWSSTAPHVIPSRREMRTRTCSGLEAVAESRAGECPGRCGRTSAQLCPQCPPCSCPFVRW